MDEARFYLLFAVCIDYAIVTTSTPESLVDLAGQPDHRQPWYEWSGWAKVNGRFLWTVYIASCSTIDSSTVPDCYRVGTRSIKQKES